jgi:hypothetical protein
VWALFSTWVAERCGINEVSPDPLLIMSFLESQPLLSLQSRHAYAKTLAAILKATSGQSNHVLQQYIQGLTALGATTPLKQAIPMQVHDLVKFAVTLPLRERVAVYLCWKTCSRWAEIAALTGSSFVEVTKTQLVICWGRTTKTTRMNPFRAQAYTVVEREAGLAEVADVVTALGPAERLTDMTTAALISKFRQRPFMKGYTAHSIKRGAIGHLADLALQGQVPLELLPLMAKHVWPLRDFPSSTLRYMPDQGTTARLLGSQRATRQL